MVGRGEQGGGEEGRSVAELRQLRIEIKTKEIARTKGHEHMCVCACVCVQTHLYRHPSAIYAHLWPMGIFVVIRATSSA